MIFDMRTSSFSLFPSSFVVRNCCQLRNFVINFSAHYKKSIEFFAQRQQVRPLCASDSAIEFMANVIQILFTMSELGTAETHCDGTNLNDHFKFRPIDKL